MVLNLNRLSLPLSRQFLIVVVSSFLILLSLPPFGISLFYWVGIILFFYFLIGDQAFHRKHIFIFFYLIQFISLIWIIQSFSSGGWGYLILGVILISFLAGFIAFLNYGSVQLINFFFREKSLWPFLLPLSLSITDLLKEFIIGGFPWNPSAIIYFNNLFVLKILPFVGVYGLGLVIHLVLGLILFSLVNRKRLMTYIISTFIILSFLTGFIQHQSNIPEGNGSLNFLVIQPNIYESLVNQNVIENLEKYEELTLEALQKQPETDIIIWPEGALPIDLNNRPGLLDRLGSILGNNQKLILGSSAIEDNGLLYNRLYVLNELGVIEQFYDKQKLVLFGEYVPWVKPFISRFLNLGMNYVPGKLQSLINLPNQVKATPMICFESIFEYQSINENICVSDLVIQISNDSWFGKWYGPQQHLANSLIRSVEFQKTLIRSTPSGVSAVIQPNGLISHRIDNNQRDYFYYSYRPSNQITNCFSTIYYVIGLLFLILFLSWIYVRVKR
jgi:apolipoprotein N-acyltransferase